MNNLIKKLGDFWGGYFLIFTATFIFSIYVVCWFLPIPTIEMPDNIVIPAEKKTRETRVYALDILPLMCKPKAFEQLVYVRSKGEFFRCSATDTWTLIPNGKILKQSDR